MPIAITHAAIQKILTRTSGYLGGVTSHSLQPYRGCTFGNSLCGVGCYVQHNGHLLRGRRWGSFLEIRDNAADSYREHASRESAWARKNRGAFSIFCSSATDPFLPQERQFGITAGILAAMVEQPPDELLLQTHSPAVLDVLPVLRKLNQCCRLRVHISIESDRETLPELPPPAASVERRLQACAELKAAGLFSVVTVAPLLPIEGPARFFARIAGAANAVVIDHFIGGDGSDSGIRTLKTQLPAAMSRIDPRSVTLDYRDEMIQMAQRFLPGRVGVSREGFAGRYLNSAHASSSC
jgi:DNA repair photolyase